MTQIYSTPRTKAISEGTYKNVMAKNPAAGLTDQQQRFCEYYLETFNATAAYLRAGYQCNEGTARRNASRLLTNANVQAYLQSLRDRITERSEVTLERTVEELGRIAFSNITDVLSFSDTGIALRNSAELPAAVTAAIEAVTFTEVLTGEGVRRRNHIKMHNKLAALALLADFFGMRDDFNKARFTLKRYGFALIQDDETDVGWKIEPYVPERTS